MNQLVIKLTGTVNSSNFDEWKKDLINQIQSTNKELVTDDDFVTASEKVKSLKLAENYLKEAKKSAIDQAEEIQNLFLAIDEVTEEARQARLSLERQVKERKEEIKNHYIQSGIEEVQKLVDKQLGGFEFIDKNSFLDRSRFESAIRGKASTKGVQQAIDRLYMLIEKEVTNTAREISNNQTKLEALPAEYKILFQDIESLLGIPEDVLVVEIDKRIARYNEEIAKSEAKKISNELKKIEDAELNPEKISSIATETSTKERFQVIIDILSSKDEAKEIAQEIKLRYGDNSDISGIRLARSNEH